MRFTALSPHNKMHQNRLITHGVILMSLLLPLNIAAFHIEDGLEAHDCSIVGCPQIPHCPVDSLLTMSSSEVQQGFEDNFGELATSNSFAGVHIEADGPIRYATEEPSATARTTVAVKEKTETKTSLGSTASPPGTENDETENTHKRHELKENALEELRNEENPLEAEQPKDDGALRRRCANNCQCVCKACPEVPQCGKNEVVVMLETGLGIPGRCCATYGCVQKLPCSIATQQIYWRDRCTKCRCFGDEELCHNQCQSDEQRSCYSPYLQKPMLSGSFWLEDNDCSECTCLNGERNCVTNLCAAVACERPVKILGKCCPVCEKDVTEGEFDTEKSGTLPTEEESTSTDAPEMTSSGPLSTFKPQESTSTTVEISPAIAHNTSTTTTLTPFETITMEPNVSASTVDPTTADADQILLSTNPTFTIKSATDILPISSCSTSTSSSPSTTLNFSLSSTSSPSSFSSPSPATNSPSASTEYPVVYNFYDTSSSSSSDALISSATSSSAFGVNTTNISSADTTSIRLFPFTIPSSKHSSISPSGSSTLIPLTNISLPSFDSKPNDEIMNSSYSVPSETSPSVAPSTASSSSPNFPSTFSSYYSSLDSSTASTASPLEAQSNNYHPNESLYHVNSLDEDYSMVSTQQQTRHLLNGINSFVIVALLLGLISCLALGAIVRHTKNNKKKLYSSIPNSEASLSQTSTNTILTV